MLDFFYSSMSGALDGGFKGDSVSRKLNGAKCVCVLNARDVR